MYISYSQSLNGSYSLLLGVLAPLAERTELKTFPLIGVLVPVLIIVVLLAIVLLIAFVQRGKGLCLCD